MTFGLDWVAAGMGVLGCYYVGKGKRYGWLLFATASAINVYVGYHSGVLGMSVAAIFYFMLEIKGWIQHRKQEES